MVPPDLGQESLPLVCFRAGGHLLAVEARHVVALGDSDDPTVPALAGRLGLPETHEDTPRLLAFRGADETPHWLAVGAPVRLEHWALTSIFPLPSLLAACLRVPGAVALALADQGACLILEPEGFLAPSSPSAGPGKERTP
ncbi:hypothetical protein [Pararhodospirillum oryzae]|uniref:CheW-like domain-containing protein n=1 Tax=Pararhodospirillum oryzae TaxID=478448 RepID=A0A512H9G0_9PROT|nr:hypothetical protein [Pararhodospirillum oryzae]GEO82096.1 hypothetical protein ROR02_22270 [Pararhodospirillum oryzae]